MDSVICFMSKCDYTSSCMFHLWLNRPVSTQILPSVICVFCAYESCRGPGEGLVVVLCILVYIICALNSSQARDLSLTGSVLRCC